MTIVRNQKFKKIYDLLETETKLIKDLKEELEIKRREQEKLLAEAISYKGIGINADELIDFFKKPYVIIPKEKNEWYVIVPSFLDFHVGFFDRREGNYNIFIINKYTQWLGEIPDILRNEIKLEKPDKIRVKGNQVLYDEQLLGKIKRKYGHHLKKINTNHAIIKRGHEFNLIADIIEEGCLPFCFQPVDKSDLRRTKLNFETTGIYSFQEDAYKEFLKYGNVGIYWLTGAGKSFFAMKVLDSLKGKKLLVTVSRTLVEQWKEYFKTFAPRLSNEVDVITYNSIDKYMNNEFICVGFDEADRLPANTFSKGALLKTKYRFGLSATPFREDGRENLIFALTGKPIGLDWKSIMKILGKKYHKVRVHILKNFSQKLDRVYELIDFDKKTIIFCDSIDIGKRISNKLKIPHIYGQTKKRMDLLRDNKVVVVSRVGDYGISIKDLEHIIEVSFLFGSRKQQLQRTGRLFHGKGKQHDILFTEEEFEKYKKRLYGFIEKGFKIEFVSTGKVSLKLPEKKIGKLKTTIRPREIVQSSDELHGYEREDKLRFLKHPTIKSILKEALSATNYPSHLKKIVGLLVSEKEPLSVSEITDKLNLPKSSQSNIYSVVSVLDRYRLVKKERHGRKQLIILNVGGLKSIVEHQKKLEHTLSDIEEIFGEESD